MLAVRRSEAAAQRLPAVPAAPELFPRWQWVAEMNRVAKVVGLAFGLATVVLLVVVLHTRPEPHVPSLEEMPFTRVAAPHLDERCSPTGGVPGLLAGEKRCHWTLKLDDGRPLEWPWADPGGDASEVGDYFSFYAPISVRHWQGTVYHIAVNDRVFLDYGDAAHRELDVQQVEVGLGLIIALLAAATLAWQVAALWGVVTHPGPHRLGVRMVWICIGGGALLVVATAPRIWWPVLYVTALVPIAVLCRATWSDTHVARHP